MVVSSFVIFTDEVLVHRKQLVVSRDHSLGVSQQTGVFAFYDLQENILQQQKKVSSTVGANVFIFQSVSVRVTGKHAHWTL